MTITTTLTNQTKFFPGKGQIFRFISTIFMVSSLIACATAPSQKSGSKPTTGAQYGTGISGAAAMYNTRDYTAAIREFNAITANGTESANTRRLAHLGKAMVYLGSDKRWHSIENAKMALMSAGQVSPKDGEEFDIETDMLMDAVSSVIGTESKYAVLVAKSSGSGQQNVKLKHELETLETQRDELLEEQKRLHVALEKLKELTLGN